MEQGQEQGQDQGGNAIKDAAAGLMASAEQEMAFAEQIGQAGQQEVAQMLMQAAQLKMKALEAMGVTGGAPQQQPQAVGQSPEAAGTGAQPATMRG